MTATNSPIAKAQVEGNPSVTITLFSKNNCSKCKLTENQFIKANVPHRYINVEEDTEPRAEFADADGNPRSPRDYVVAEFGTAMPAVELRQISADGSTVRYIDWNDMNPARITEVKTVYGIPAE